MAARRDRYFNSSDALAFASEGLALNLESGDLSRITDSHFQVGLCQLCNNQLDQAENHLRIAKNMSEQNGDLTFLTRALTYLAVVCRKRGDLRGVRDYAAYGLKIAKEARMPQYTGTARAEYAWLAWREEDITQTIYQAQAAIDDWDGLGAEQTVVGFRWLALFPLIGVALRQDNIAQAVTWSQQLILPTQQRLPDDLTGLIEGVISAWQQGLSEMAHDLVWQAFRLAQEQCYV